MWARDFLVPSDWRPSVQRWRPDWSLAVPSHQLEPPTCQGLSDLRTTCPPARPLAPSLPPFPDGCTQQRCPHHHRCCLLVFAESHTVSVSCRSMLKRHQTLCPGPEFEPCLLPCPGPTASAPAVPLHPLPYSSPPLNPQPPYGIPPSKVFPVRHRDRVPAVLGPWVARD